jgi:hypothetical protein
MNYYFTWHIFLEVDKIQDSAVKIWQTLGDTLSLAAKILLRLFKQEIDFYFFRITGDSHDINMALQTHPFPTSFWNRKIQPIEVVVRPRGRCRLAWRRLHLRPIQLKETKPMIYWYVWAYSPHPASWLDPAFFPKFLQFNLGSRWQILDNCEMIVHVNIVQ